MINRFEKFHLEIVHATTTKKKTIYLTLYGSQKFHHIEMFPLAVDVCFLSTHLAHPQLLYSFVNSRSPFLPFAFRYMKFFNSDRKLFDFAFTKFVVKQ